MKKTISLLGAIFFAAFTTAQVSVIPMPNKMVSGGDNFEINKETVLFSNEKSSANLLYMQSFLKNAAKFGFNRVKQAPSSNYIILELSSAFDIPQEGYKLSVTGEGITIKASSESGIFYGIQTLFQMLPPVIYSGNPKGDENWTIQGVEIEDFPRFGYRGMHLDVSRTFFDAATVKNFINWLSHHKINKFHWHLTDDNGWRIEVKKYPKLTELGAW
ncbi:MAG: beta-N-acetylhexosaminidase, partial [Bacteroidia bacterium]|nr:beta-N-acetylhexosaminidase [Bacteroidia bacterium]